MPFGEKKTVGCAREGIIFDHSNSPTPPHSLHNRFPPIANVLTICDLVCLSVLLSVRIRKNTFDGPLTSASLFCETKTCCEGNYLSGTKMFAGTKFVLWLAPLARPKLFFFEQNCFLGQIFSWDQNFWGRSQSEENKLECAISSASVQFPSTIPFWIPNDRLFEQ